MDSLVRFSEINQSKPFDFHLILSNQKVAELVKRLDLLSIKKVSLVGILSPLSINEWSLKAELRATVKQKCVISFKPVKTIVCETINRTFSPAASQNTSKVVDDDGNTSTTDLQIEILNQRPVALFERPPDGEIGDAYIFSSSSFDPDGDSSELSHYWTFSDRESPIENATSVSRTFSNPGLHSVSLTVIDERGLESAPKTFLLYIENPLPVPIMTFSCPSDEEGLMFEIPEEGIIPGDTIGFIKYEDTDGTWQKVQTYYKTTLGLKSDGTLWAWGRNAKKLVVNPASQSEVVYEPLQVIMPPEPKDFDKDGLSLIHI